MSTCMMALPPRLDTLSAESGGAAAAAAAAAEAEAEAVVAVAGAEAKLSKLGMS